MTARLIETHPVSLCGASDVPSACLCCILNINRAEKCPEWNEFASECSLVMEVISKVEAGDTMQHGDKMQMVMSAD